MPFPAAVNLARSAETVTARVPSALARTAPTRLNPDRASEYTLLVSFFRPRR